MPRCALLALCPALLLAQVAVPPAFEVADVRPTDPTKSLPGKGGFLPGGRVEIRGATIRNFLGFAYSVQEHMISNLPKWADSERFDVVAKAPADVAFATLRLMLQTLLVERFKLTIHREEKLMPAYALVRGKRDLKLPQGSGGRQDCHWSVIEGGLRRRECRNITMMELAALLPSWTGIGIDRSVVDETGLKGSYDLQFDMGFPPRVRPDGDRRSETLTPPADSGPTIFAALEQIGLKLESRKMPLPVIVVDHVERIPTEN